MPHGAPFLTFANVMPVPPVAGTAGRFLLRQSLGLMPWLGVALIALGTATAHAQQAPAATGVQTRPVEQVWVLPEREAPASVRARNESRLAAEVSATLLGWTVDVGDRVAAAQVMARLDPRDLELALQQAQAGLAAAEARRQLAQTQLNRARELVTQNFLSREALAQREAEAALAQSEERSAQATLAVAQRQLARTVVRAPFAGVVKERRAQKGERVAPGEVLFVLSEAGHAELEATLNPSDVAGLRRAEAPVFEAQGQRHTTRLLRVAGVVERPARTQQVRLALDGEAPAAGTSGTLRWRDPQPHLPPAVMVRRGEALGVFVLRDGRARFVPLPQAQEGRAAPLPQGLAAGAALIVRGQSALMDGQAVVAP